MLAPWAYIASVLYHDSFWYPALGRRMMKDALASDWGRLFQNWGRVQATAEGYPEIGAASGELERTGLKALLTSVGILGTCIKEAPEFSNRRRKVVTVADPR